MEKAAGRDRRQRRGDRIEQREARNAQQQRLRHGERDVDAVQDARRLTRAGAELCADGAGGFRFHQVHAALAELGQQRQHQNEDTHAAHPLRERAPELDALRQRRRRREDGRAGRRQAGDGLENGVDKAAAAAEKNTAARRTRSARSSTVPRRQSRRASGAARCPRG